MRLLSFRREINRKSHHSSVATSCNTNTEYHGDETHYKTRAQLTTLIRSHPDKPSSATGTISPIHANTYTSIQPITHPLNYPLVTDSTPARLSHLAVCHPRGNTAILHTQLTEHSRINFKLLFFRYNVYITGQVFGRFPIKMYV